MATQKQIEANRLNAKKSTGPRTEDGKSKSRENAIQHGLTANTLIYKPIRHENADDFHAMRADLIASWNPIGTKELQLVELIASAYKRIQRSEAFETGYFDLSLEHVQHRNDVPRKPTGRDDAGCGMVFGDPNSELSWKNLDRYRRNGWLDYHRAVRELQKMQKDRLDEPVREIRRQKWQEDYAKRTTAQTECWLPKSTTSEELASFRQQRPGVVFKLWEGPEIDPNYPENRPIKYPEAA